jgi:hypothetical protein
MDIINLKINDDKHYLIFEKLMVLNVNRLERPVICFPLNDIEFSELKSLKH